MSTRFYGFVGPYYLCKVHKVKSAATKTCCPNHPNVMGGSVTKFCPQCGKELVEVEEEIEMDNVDLAGIETGFDDDFQILNQCSEYFERVADEKNVHIWYPVIDVASIGEIDQEDVGFSSIDPADIASEIMILKSHPMLKALQGIYGGTFDESNVSVKWGTLLWIA